MASKKEIEQTAPEMTVGGIGDALGAKDRPVAELTEVVDAVIRFANGEIRPDWKTRAFAMAKYHRAQLQKNLDEFKALKKRGIDADAHIKQVRNELRGEYLVQIEGVRGFTDEKTAKAIHEAEIDEEVVFARKLMTTAASGREPVAVLFGSGVLKTPVTLEPKPSIRGGRAFLQWKLVGPSRDSRPWVEFAALLLAMTEREITDVGQCQLESCGKFFRIDWHEGNRPRTRYCCQEHRLEQNRLGATKRKQESRKAKARRAK